MTTIQKDKKVLTVINVFTVSPERQDELLQQLVKNTDDFISACPGFISANFHKSIDGKNVINYGQWESMEALQGMLKTEGGQQMLADGNKIATAIQPNVYTVYDTREA
jgi:quinol monooxygenase YgiN